jgi:DNA-binding YbaB/EbfC family protein
MKGGLGNLMRQAQAMQENMKKVQEELASLEVTGTAGGGMVTVVMTCRHDVRKITIDPELMSDDREVLEDLIAAAFNDAARKVDEESAQRMSGITGGMGIPGLNLPF